MEHAGSMFWAARAMRQHMTAYGSTREDFGRVAVDNRTNAAGNPQAVFRTPITIGDYLASPAIDAPMHLLDMDAPVDGALAVAVTTVERARDLPHRPVSIDSFASALLCHNDGLYWPEADAIAARRAVGNLFGHTDLQPADMDIAYPYDGFTILAMRTPSSA
ncbi:MAG TPA: hypothetical protein VHC18_27680 [Amycolatopsis sp.]|nr:hypothetical protein [Amycolatopsis sp.]